MTSKLFVVALVRYFTLCERCSVLYQDKNLEKSQSSKHHFICYGQRLTSNSLTIPPKKKITCYTFLFTFGKFSFTFQSCGMTEIIHHHQGQQSKEKRGENHSLLAGPKEEITQIPFLVHHDAGTALTASSSGALKLHVSLQIEVTGEGGLMMGWKAGPCTG